MSFKAISPRLLSAILVLAGVACNRNDGQPTDRAADSSAPAPDMETLFLMLPFTAEDEPSGIQPMGETINHPNFGGHPGIDFQWRYRAPIVVSSAGEIVQITTEESTVSGVDVYSVSVITDGFIVHYEATDFLALNPDLDIGSPVVVGQRLGYAQPVAPGDDGHMIHWAFGRYEKTDESEIVLYGFRKANQDGVIEYYKTNFICSVPYFVDSERERLFRIWETAAYDARGKFPDLCNGIYKNY